MVGRLSVAGPFGRRCLNSARHAPVSTRRSSNRTCPIKASGSRTRSHAFRSRRAARPAVSCTAPGSLYKIRSGNCVVPGCRTLCLAFSHRRSPARVLFHGR